MPVTRLTYEEFAERTERNPQDPLSALTLGDKVAYVYALTRDLCSGCETQKPLFEKLAKSVQMKYGDQVEFNTIHVRQDGEFRAKLQDFRRILKFAAYPTYLILLKTELGVIEVYRAIEPPMEEIERNINVAVELANR